MDAQSEEEKETEKAGAESFSGMWFLPVFGGGRDAAYREFGEDVPLVYSSPDPNVAKTYPQALVDANGDYCGEAVASDVACCRVNIEAKAWQC